MSNDQETPGMEPSEYEPTQEAPQIPMDEPSVVPAVPPEAVPPDEPPAPLEPAEPGLYWCEDADPGIHPVLGRLVEGENDFSGVTHPDSLMAIAAMVRDGALVKV